MSSTQSRDLAQLRTQAKELLQAIRRGDRAALERALVYFPAQQELRLTNAQLIIARENGFSSWPAMQRQLSDTRPPDRVGEIFGAIERRDAALVRELIDETPNLAGAWRRSKYDGWESALHVAAGLGLLEISKILVEAGADVYPLRQSDYPPVFAAYYGKNQELTEYLLNASAEKDHGHPPTYGCGIDIVLAARIGMLDRIQMHLRKDPFAIYRRGCIGETVLHWPAHNGHVEVVEELIRAGAIVDADEIGLYGGKPLHWASEHAPSCVRVLLAHGADPNSRNLMPGEFEGFTPLHMCASQREECTENADLLLAAGAELLAKDAKGQTPYDVAKQRNHQRMADFLAAKTSV